LKSGGSAVRVVFWRSAFRAGPCTSPLEQGVIEGENPVFDTDCRCSVMRSRRVERQQWRPKRNTGLQPNFFRPKVSNNGASSVNTVTFDLDLKGDATNGNNSIKIVPIAPWANYVEGVFDKNFHYVQMNWIEVLVMPWTKGTETAQYVSWIDDCSIGNSIESTDAGLGLATWAQSRNRTRVSTSEGTILRAVPNRKWVANGITTPHEVTLENSFCEVGVMGLSSDNEKHTMAKICIRFSLTYKDKKVLDKVSRFNGLTPSTFIPECTVYLPPSHFLKVGSVGKEGSLVPRDLSVSETIRKEVGVRSSWTQTAACHITVTESLVSHLKEHVSVGLMSNVTAIGYPAFESVALKFNNRPVPSFELSDNGKYRFIMGLKFKHDTQITSVQSPKVIPIYLGSRGPREWDVSENSFEPTMRRTVWRVNDVTETQTMLSSDFCEGEFVTPVDWLVYQDQLLIVDYEFFISDPRPGVDLLAELERQDVLGHQLRLPHFALGGWISED